MLGRASVDVHGGILAGLAMVKHGPVARHASAPIRSATADRPRSGFSSAAVNPSPSVMLHGIGQSAAKIRMCGLIWSRGLPAADLIEGRSADAGQKRPAAHGDGASADADP